MKTVFVDKAENILALLKITDQLPTLKRIVMTKKLSGDKEAEVKKKAQEINIELFTYNQLRVRIHINISDLRSLSFSVGNGTSKTSSSSCKFFYLG